MVTANGNYITKQSIGIYSSEPLKKQFQIKDPNIYQKEINKKFRANFIQTALWKLAKMNTLIQFFDRRRANFQAESLA